MVISTLRIVSAPGSQEAVVRILAAQLDATRAQPGCLQCDLYQDVADRHILSLVEEWESHAELRLRLASEEYRIVLEAMELSQEPPEIHFDTVSSRAGLELIEAARQECPPGRGASLL